jgi:hypothetical protein
MVVGIFPLAPVEQFGATMGNHGTTPSLPTWLVNVLLRKWIVSLTDEEGK